MKLDYRFLKQILSALESNNSSYMQSYDLMEHLGIFNQANLQVIDDSKMQQFNGHIHILGDNKCIESSSNDYGCKYNIRTNNYLINNTTYRMTAQGYEFLEMLRKKNIVEKIKNLTVPVALEVSKSLILKSISS